MFKRIIICFILVIISTPAEASPYSDSGIKNNIAFDITVLNDNTIALAKMFEKVRLYYDKKNEKKSVLNIQYAPNFDTKTVKTFVEAYLSASDFYKIGFGEVFFFNETQIYWYLSHWNEIDNSDGTIWFKDVCNLNEKNFCAMNPLKQRTYYFNMVGTAKSNSDLDPWVAHHEVIHGLQNTLGITSNNNCWVIEGQANALANISYIYSNQYNENVYIKNRDAVIEETKKILGFEINKDKYIQNFLKITSNKETCFHKSIGYSVGTLIIEYLYINFPIENVNGFIKEISFTNNLTLSLKNNIGIDEEFFLNHAFDYVVERMSYPY